MGTRGETEWEREREFGVGETFDALLDGPAAPAGAVGVLLSPLRSATVVAGDTNSPDEAAAGVAGVPGGAVVGASVVSTTLRLQLRVSHLIFFRRG